MNQESGTAHADTEAGQPGEMLRGGPSWLSICSGRGQLPHLLPVHTPALSVASTLGTVLCDSQPEVTAVVLFMQAAGVQPGRWGPRSRTDFKQHPEGSADTKGPQTMSKSTRGKQHLKE